MLPIARNCLHDKGQSSDCPGGTFRLTMTGRMMPASSCTASRTYCRMCTAGRDAYKNPVARLPHQQLESTVES